MNSKKLKKKKEENVFSKLKNDNTEVLVLPPNLLEKLGINLENIQQDINNSVNTSSTENLDFIVPTTHGEKQNMAIEKFYVNSSNDETSILKTANLMKESVLLSPTFTSLKPNDVLDDEDTNFLNNPEKSIEDKQIVSNHNNFVANGHTDSLNFKEVENEKLNNNCAKLTKEQICNTISNTDLEADISKRISLSPDTLLSLESCGFRLDISTTNIDHKPTSKPNNKITILSQELLDTEKIKQLKVLNSIDTKMLIPLKIDESLSKTNTNIIEKTDLKKLESQSSLNKEKQEIIKDIKKNDKIRCVIKKFISRKRENNSLNECQISLSKNESSPTDVGEINNLVYDTQSDQRCLKKLGVLDISHKGDSSKETRSRISIDAINNNSFPIPAESTLCNMENIKDVHIHDNGYDSKDKKFDSEENIVTSKLCIQGVEKPGGELEFFTVNRSDLGIKTYKNKSTKSFYPKKDTLEMSLEINADIDYKLNVQKEKFQVLSKFCICKDFGTFSSFDSEGVELNYEHVHFLKQENTNCSLEDLFSIYEDKYNIEKNMEAEKIFQNYDCHFKEIVINDTFDNNICFHNIESVNKLNELNQNVILDKAEFSKNICFGTNENSLQTKTVVHKENVTDENKHYEKVNIDKRKRCSNSESNDEIIPKKQVLLTIRCEACGNRVEKMKWEDHISKRHCFIAWKEGENINMEDKKLLLKLNWRLHETGKLVCAFCDTNHNNLQNFIDDVKSCISKRCSVKKYGTQNRKRTKNSEIDQSATQSVVLIRCGVCQSEVEENLWFDHIGKEHNYLAWEQGANPVDCANERKVLDFLKLTKNIIGTLECSYCGVNRTQVASYIKHVKHCANVELLSPKSKIYRENENQSDPVISSKPTKRKSLSKSEISKPECERVTCGVCHIKVMSYKWVDHIRKKHAYLAWKEGEEKLNCADEKAVINFLKITANTIGPLECSRCGIKFTKVSSYVKHLKNCANIELLSPNNKIYNEKENESEPVSSSKRSKRKCLSDPEIIETECEQVTCGVCHMKVENSYWIDHIRKEHAYLAWKEGEEELDVDDIQEVNDHLYALTKENDGLVCAKCGIRRKYVKSYLTHIAKCNGESTTQDTTLETTLNESSMVDMSTTSVVDDDDGEKMIKCGVCHKDLEQKCWLIHLQKEHSYLAWMEGQPVLNLENQQEVMQHLNEMNKKYNGLSCNKCGITRKYVKVYLSHIESCDSTVASSVQLKQEGIGKDSCECAVCSEIVDSKDWKSHAMKKHYNIAWAVGDLPIDVKNPYAVENYLKEYKKIKKTLHCFVCGTSRASLAGFYAHIIQCGKSEEEIDEFRNHCDICDSKYLCIYKNQHMQLHREQEYAKERKKLMEETKMKEENKFENDSPSEGRLAAKRTRSFIGKYQKFEHNCPKCDFGTDEENDLETHKCGKKMYKDYSDSDESAHIDSSSDESEEVESIASLSENEINHTVRKQSESRSFATRIKRIPFEIKNTKAYLNQSAEEFRKIHYTTDTLYPHWRDCKYETVPDEEIPKYMPPINESCQLQTSGSDWKTLNMFDSMEINGGYTVFVGSSIRCISWATCSANAGIVPIEGGNEERHFLAVSCYNASDSPRLDSSETYSHANMLQIWDFGNFKTSDPKFALGIAHEYGIVWSMDWCASGSRDVLKHSKTFQRLGLLAAACSNGYAYIFSVPYPASIINSDKIIYNLTPVAQLRLCRSQRKNFQATAISWSPQRGHSVVLVGYSDGTTASFDLETESPLLKDTIDGLYVLYPFHDERSHNSSITGVSALAGGHAGRAGRAFGMAAASSVSPTGAETVRRGVAGLRLRAHLPCSAVAHSDLWPSALLAQNDGIVTQAVNELDWWGWGQRLGAVHACGACQQCGVLAAAAPPLLRLMTPHPAHPALNKEPIAYINMTPLAQKQSKQKTDELALKLQPYTYEAAVKLYGIEFKYIKELDKNRLQQIYNKPKDVCHERFPLNDIPSMAFNPSPKYHRKLAVATHAGFIFIISV